MSVLNLIPGSGMGKAVPYEAGFPGNCTVDHDILGALVTQNSLMSVLLNAHEILGLQQVVLGHRVVPGEQE